jgi:ring-1,2-phenylacetyl-CoA epoxidase subunit PaaD
MVTQTHTKEDIFRMLSVIPDPEIPVVNIEEMGMLRDVIISDEGYEVILTPTYSGCPAMSIITQDIKMTLANNQVHPASVKLVYDPAWTTDWMTNEAKTKLKRYGIAPPLHSSCSLDVFSHNIIQCPHCNSGDTVVISRFGATACKSLYQCNECKEPFEYFKCH